MGDKGWYLVFLESDMGGTFGGLKKKKRGGLQEVLLYFRKHWEDG